MMRLDQRNSSEVGKCLPFYWKLCKEYKGSLQAAIVGLAKQRKAYEMHEVDHFELREIEKLVHNTWRETLLQQTPTEVVTLQLKKVERLENPVLLEKYYHRKRALLRSMDHFTEKAGRLKRRGLPVPDRKPRTAGHIRTTRTLLEMDSFLIESLNPKINEHYLFYGVGANSGLRVVRDGLGGRHGNEGSVGGIRSYDSSTKADQVAGNYHQETGELKMLLVRALLGEPYIRKGSATPAFVRPPCMSCQLDRCVCPHANRYDSVLDDCGLLFREFVVYEQCQCYPEYLVTYTRVYATPATHQAPYQAMFKKTSNVCCITWKKLRDVIIATMIVALIHAFALVFYGVSQVGECPAMPYTPLYLQLQGVFTIILFSTTPGLACTMHKIKDEWAEVLVWPVFVVLCIIVANGLYLLLQIAGYILVIPKANAFSSVHASNLSNDSDTHDNYCNPSVYYYAYVTTVWHTIVYVFYIVWMTELCFRHTNCCKGLAEYILGFAGLIVGTIGSVVMSGFCFGATDYVLKKTDATVCPTTNNLWILELVTGFLLCPLAILCLCVVLGCNGRCHIVSSWCSSLYITATFAVHIFGFVYLNETYSLPKDCVTDEVKFVHFNNCGGTLVSFLWVSLIQCYVTDFRFKAN